MKSTTETTFERIYALREADRDRILTALRLAALQSPTALDAAAEALAILANCPHYRTRLREEA